MQTDYSSPATRDGIFALLETSFPGLPARVRLAEAAGASWCEISTPFVACAGEQIVAHAGVIAIPMVVGGVSRPVAGIHAVCTHPDFRGRSYARAVMEEAVAYADRLFGASILFTGIPPFYERFGFCYLPERVFTIHGPARGGKGQPARRLSLAEERDVEILQRILPRRAPVSRVLSAVDPGWLFLINEVLATGGFGRLLYVEDLDLVIACGVKDGTLRLLDLAGEEIPDLGTILARIQTDFATVELYFTPDRVWDGPVWTGPSDADDCLMARGDFDPTGEFVLSPLARC